MTNRHTATAECKHNLGVFTIIAIIVFALLFIEAVFERVDRYLDAIDPPTVQEEAPGVREG